MADSALLYNLRFANYESFQSAQQKSVIPADLLLSPSAVAAVNMTLPHFAFVKEYELIASSGDSARKSSTSAQPIEPTISPPAKPIISSAVPAVTMPTFTPTFVQTPIPDSQLADETARHEALTQAMMKETQKDHDLCYFFLESVDWNLPQAIQMLHSMG